MTLKNILTASLLAFSFLQIKAQVGIGTTTPDASAVLELSADNKGLLPPRLNTAQRNAIVTPAEGLTIYNTDLKCLDTFNGARWIACNTIGVNDVFNTLTGQIWMNQNLGASQVAVSSSDSSANGFLFQWGRSADGHQQRLSGTYNGELNPLPATPTESGAWNGLYITVTSNPRNWFSGLDDTLWQGVSGGNNPCPTGYRVPSEAEWLAEIDSWDGTMGNGYTGTNGTADAFASGLKLTTVGSRSNNNGAFNGTGINGRYWSSNLAGSNARNLTINSASASMGNSNRATGAAVRCIKG